MTGAKEEVGSRNVKGDKVSHSKDVGSIKRRRPPFVSQVKPLATVVSFIRDLSLVFIIVTTMTKVDYACRSYLPPGA